MQYCYGLESLSLPSTIQTLNLTGLYRLKSIVIPTAATNVTLSNLGIESLHIPSTVTKITCNYLNNLKYISVDYGFNINGLDLTTSTCLSKDCIVSLLENLADRTTTGVRTLTLGSINLAKLSAEEKLIATNKNWTLA